jgi:hypothetical protein
MKKINIIPQEKMPLIFMLRKDLNVIRNIRIIDTMITKLPEIQIREFETMMMISQKHQLTREETQES